MNDNDLDTPVYGASAIAQILNLRNRAGEIDPRQAFYGVAMGYIDADKYGRRLTSTKRRLLGKLNRKIA
jgi:hypothetical protein